MFAAIRYFLLLAAPISARSEQQAVNPKAQLAPFQLQSHESENIFFYQTMSDMPYDHCNFEFELLIGHNDASFVDDTTNIVENNGFKVYQGNLTCPSYGAYEGCYRYGKPYITLRPHNNTEACFGDPLDNAKKAQKEACSEQDHRHEIRELTIISYVLGISIVTLAALWCCYRPSVREWFGATCQPVKQDPGALSLEEGLINTDEYKADRVANPQPPGYFS